MARVVMFPYETLTGSVNGKVTSVDVDGRTPPQLDIIRTDVAHVVDLAGQEITEWSESILHVSVSGPPSEIKELVERGAEPEAYALVNCARSNTRLGVRLKLDPREKAVWSGEVPLSREDYFGSVRLNFVVLATIDGVSHRIVGEAPEWIVSLDDLPPIDIDGTLPVSWLDFSAESPPSRLVDFADLPSYLVLDPDKPKVYLNKGFPRLPQLFDEIGQQTPMEVALKGTLLSDIAAKAWRGLFQAALTAVLEQTPEEDQAIWPESRWQRAVLQGLLPRMYPHFDSGEALQAAVTAARSTEGTCEVTSLATAAADQHALLPRSMTAAFNKLEEGVL